MSWTLKMTHGMADRFDSAKSRKVKRRLVFLMVYLAVRAHRGVQS